MTESDLQQIIQMEGPKFKCILLRNNSGALVDKDGRLVRFGLGNTSKKRSDEIKSSDLIGITTITITADMVGQQIGVFTAVEVKDPNIKLTPGDKRLRAQTTFCEWVRARGGFAGIAQSIQDFRQILGR